MLMAIFCPQKNNVYDTFAAHSFFSLLLVYLYRLGKLDCLPTR